MKKTILILLLLTSGLLRVDAQTRNITGRVTDSDGEPLIGAVVEIVGTTRAAGTNIDGMYSLTNVPADATLKASFIGFEPVEKRADSERLDFVLESGSTMISEVV
ncbi:MAG: carboxypeptidase-like regulatory domain-containing protein, partial [Alistipes sp.]|nr:carboxypeptidase-like regulatory domain-containing protein [Alistipes sp.]